MAKLVTVNNANKTVTRRVFMSDDEGMAWACEQARVALSVVTDSVEVVEATKRSDAWESHLACDC